MFDSYFPHKVPWKQQAGQNDNGMYEHATAITVKGWVRYQRKLVRNKDGEQVMSEAMVMTSAPMQPGDLITWDDRDWLVIAMESITVLGGAEVYRILRV